MIHLPIDGILKRISQKNPFVLGFTTVSGARREWKDEVVKAIAGRCSDKTGRSSFVIKMREAQTELTAVHGSEPSLQTQDQASWSYLAGTALEKQRWNAQLSELLRWKQQFGLIIIDLGDAGFPELPRIGRLCDGVVVQISDPSHAQGAIDAMRKLQSCRLPILGVWSLEMGTRTTAA